jgi:tetratricopeptide (TPR) repeat protein
MDDLLKGAQIIDIGPQDNQTSMLNKYLIVAEKQMGENNYWEAEQVVDAALRAVGERPTEQSRLTQDMLNLADGLDARGDLERAERVLKKVLEVRAQNGRLDDPDAERTIDHLTELYISDKRYSDALEMLNKLISNPNLSQINNPVAFANNLERLGVCHFKNKNYDQALSEFSQVVALKRQQKGDRSPALAMALEELGDTYKAQGQNTDAQSNYKEAHAIYDHAVVSSSRVDKMDYAVYSAHVKQLDKKISTKQ